MTMQVKLNSEDVQRKLGLLSAGLQRGAIIAVADWLKDTVIKAFQGERSPEGVPWKPLSPLYGRMKGARTGRGFARKVNKRGRPGEAVFLNRKRILVLSGGLSRGFVGEQATGYAIQENSVTASSFLPYAAAHQFGSTHMIPEIRPKKKGGVLRFYGGAGDAIFARRAKAHPVTIPARPFLPSPEFAEREAAAAIDEAVQTAINIADAGR